MKFFAPKFQYNNAIVRKSGSQTLFNVFVPLGSKKFPAMVIKFYNQKMSPEALIQYVASYQYFFSQNSYYELELSDKIIVMKPANILYFSIYDFTLGKISRKIPIIVQESIDENYSISDYLERKDLSRYTKMMTKQGFTLDSYESNWKIKSIAERDGKSIYYCHYIDIFQSTEYEKIRYLINKIMVELEKSK